jgi:hypothetical protein
MNTGQGYTSLTGQKIAGDTTKFEETGAVVGGIAGAIGGYGVGAIPGALIGGAAGAALGSVANDVFGEKYYVPNPGQTAGQAITGDLNNLSGIYGLSTGADTAAAAGAASQYQLNLPNYSGMLNSATTNAGQELQGQVPADVQRQLQTAAAERGVAGGGGANSPNTNAAYLQALGLTSLDMNNRGMSDFNTLYRDTPTGPQFDPSSMFVTPEQQQAAQLAANKEAAAPDPAMAGIFNTGMAFM